MDKLAGILHLCKKAGKLHFGQQAVLSLLDSNKLNLVVMSSDAGRALKRKITGQKILTVE